MLFRLLPSLLILCFTASLSQAAPVFSAPGFVVESVHQGNGTISLSFDPAGRLWVTEKQGRILVLKPNPTGATEFRYDYFETPSGSPSWQKMPDFKTLQPIASGVSSNFSLDPKQRNDDFGFRFTGAFQATSNGTHTFYISADDGCRLFIDGKLIVDCEDMRGREKSGSAELSAGSHDVLVEYYEAKGGEGLKIEFEAPGTPRRTLASGPFEKPTVFADIVSKVNSEAERGMLGLALDPNFATNRWLYVLYSTSSDQRIVRFTSNREFTSVEPGSELLLLSGLPNNAAVHKAGDIGFHPSDPKNLYVMLGDDGDRTKANDLNEYRGKLLKISASTGKGLPDNPFYDGNPDSVRSRIWAQGFRNPFRFCFGVPGMGDLIYVSENGDGTDRIARIEKGADGGWPEKFLTDSNDGKRRILHTTGPSLTAITLINGGPFAPEGVVVYDAKYGGKDRREVRRWKLVGEKLDRFEEIAGDQGKPFLTGLNAFNVVTLKQGPDGSLYFTDSNQGDSKGERYEIGRFRFTGGAAPIADFSTSTEEGPVPLEVKFKDKSTAPGDAVAGWTWKFGDGSQVSTQAVNHVYGQPGVYRICLEVANRRGVTARSEKIIRVYQKTNVSLAGTISDARKIPSELMNGPATLRFFQTDGVTPLSFPGGKGEDGNEGIIKDGRIQGTISVNLTGPGMVVTALAEGFQPASVGIPIDFGKPAQQGNLAFRLSDTTIRGRAVDTRGRPASVDIGLSKENPGKYAAFDGGRDLLRGAGKSGILHRTVADALGYFHIPLAEARNEERYFIDTSADTLSTTHGKVTKEVKIKPGDSSILNLTIGLYNAGEKYDTLAAAPPIVQVDFDRQIQPILTSLCVGCHNGIATNSAGLDLQPGRSLAQLMGKPSVGAPGVMLVEPGAPEKSFLMEKINCERPQTGTRMRPGDPIPLQQQALIRDWIRGLPKHEG